jgi:hypothetical protein
LKLADCLDHDLGPVPVSRTTPLDPTFSYCGPVDLATCQNGYGYGACRPEFEIAAGTTDPARIMAAWSQSTTVIGAAVNVAYGIATGDPRCAGHTALGLRTVATPCSGGCSAPSTIPPVTQTCPTAPMVWTETNLIPQSSYDTIWSDGPDDTWASVSSKLSYWDGTAFVPGTPAWGLARLPTWGRDRSNLWFSSSVNGITVDSNIAWWNGSAWRAFPINAISVFPIGKTGAWIVSQGRLLEWDGALMHERTPPQIVGGRISAATFLTVAATDDVWALISGRTADINPAGNPAIAARAMHWDGQAWTETSLPTPNDAFFVSAWANAKNDVLAVAYRTDQGPSLWHFDGTAWNVASIPAGAGGGLAGLTGLGSNDVWAAGNSGVLRYDGMNWSNVPNDTGVPMQLVAVGADDQVWAFGKTGGFNSAPVGHTFSWHHDCAGTGGFKQDDSIPIGGPFTWTTTPVGVAGLLAFPPNDAWRLANGSVERWNGTQWVGEATSVGCLGPNDGFVMLAGSSAQDVWVSSANYLQHWDGMMWNGVSPPPPTSTDTTGPSVIWSLSANDFWMSRWNVRGISGDTPYHWNGATWEERPFPVMLFPRTGTPAPYYVYAFWGAATNDVWAFGAVMQETTTGSVAVTLFAHWDGQAWTVVGDLTSADFQVNPATAAWGAAGNNIWATSVKGLWHYDGRAWTLTSDAFSNQRVWGSGPNDVWFAGTASLRHWDGATTTSLDLGVTSYLYGASPAPGEVWIAGQYFSFGSVLFHGLAK